MSYPKYQRKQEDVPLSQNPPCYLENQPNLPKTPTESTHCVKHEKSPVVPPQDLPTDGPDRTASTHIPVLHQPQTTITVPVHYTEEPDYLGCSVFTMLFCFLPVGIAAFIFSLLTRQDNREGNITAAQRHSRIAISLVLISFGIGLLVIIIYFILIII